MQFTLPASDCNNHNADEVADSYISDISCGERLNLLKRSQKQLANMDALKVIPAMLQYSISNAGYDDACPPGCAVVLSALFYLTHFNTSGRPSQDVTLLHMNEISGMITANARFYDSLRIQIYHFRIESLILSDTMALKAYLKKYSRYFETIAESSDDSVLERVRHRGVDVNRDGRSATPALAGDQQEVYHLFRIAVRFILSAVECRYALGFRLPMFYVESCSCMELLLKRCSVFDKEFDLEKYRLDGSTILHHAVQRGNEELTALLLNLGANVNCRTSEGLYTPLHICLTAACFSGMTLSQPSPVDIDKFLSGAAVPTAQHSAIVDWVALKDEQQVSEAFRSNFVGDKVLSLQEATASPYFRIAQLLLSAGADLKATDSRGLTSDFRVRVAFLALHQEIQHMVASALTPLHQSLFTGDNDEHILDILEQSPEMAAKPTPYGKMPLHLALENDKCHGSVILAILKACPSAGLKPMSSSTSKDQSQLPFFYALENIDKIIGLAPMDVLGELLCQTFPTVDTTSGLSSHSFEDERWSTWLWVLTQNVNDDLCNNEIKSQLPVSTQLQLVHCAFKAGIVRSDELVYCTNSHGRHAVSIASVACRFCLVCCLLYLVLNSLLGELC